MALDKQTIPVALQQGINTKLDDKQQVQGSLKNLENAVFTKVNRINKRNGYLSLKMDTISGNALESLKALSTLRDELNAYSDTTLYSYSKNSEAWKSKGSIFNIDISSDQIVRNDYEQSEIKSVVLNNISLYTWKDSRGGFRFSTMDNQTGTVFAHDQVLLSGSEDNVKLEYFEEGIFYAFYTDAGTIKYKKMELTDPTTFSAAVTATSTLNSSDPIYSIKRILNKIFVSFNSTSNGGEMGTFTVDIEDTISTVVGLASETPDVAIDITTDESSRVLILFADSSSIKVVGYTFNLQGVILAKTTIESVSDLNNCSILHDSEDDFVIMYDITSTSNTDYIVKKSGIDLTAAVVAPTVLLRSVGLASKLFKCNDIVYTTVLHESELQATYFIVNTDGLIVGKIAPGNSGDQLGNNEIPRVFEISECEFLLGTQIKGRVLSEDNTLFSLLGVEKNIIDFLPSTTYQDTAIGDLLYITGGILQMYDGVAVVEDNFHVFPEGITAESSNIEYRFGVEVTVGGDVNATATNLATAIDGHPDVTAIAVGDTVTVTAEEFGTEGNNIQLKTNDGDGRFSFSDITLTGGTASTKASGTIQVVDNTIDEFTQATGFVQIVAINFEPGDKVTINGVDFEEGVEFFRGTTVNQTAESLKIAIESSTNVSIKDVITVNIDGGSPDTIDITAVEWGTGGNAITLAESDGSTNNFNISGPTLTGGSLGDFIGIDSSSTGGNISDGTYQYVAVYSWTDNRGQLHRSASSIPITSVLSGGTDTQKQYVKVPTLRLTEKENVVIELYRTEDTGTIFRKVTSVSQPNFNDKTIDSITIIDTLADSDLISNEILYTTGDVLQNSAAPNASIIEVYKDRIFLAGLEDKEKVAYSKIKSEGFGVEFSDFLTIRLDDENEPVTALKTMDDKLIFFKKSNIYALVGEGPTNTGAQNDYRTPVLISSDTGCDNPNSIVLVPQGLMFQSDKGIYLLTRSLSLNYLGAPVEDFNNLTVSSAVLVEDKNQIRFTTEDQCLVYDYLVDQWSTFTNHDGLDATIYDDRYVYLKTDGRVMQEEPGYFLDDADPVTISFETNWISLAGIQNFKRVYNMKLLGEFKTHHLLKIDASYDFEDILKSTKTIDTKTFLNDTTYGNDATYGSTSPYGGTDKRYQVKFDFKTQKCQSLKLKISELQRDDFGEGLTLSNINFTVGVKKGSFKLPSSRVFGTSGDE